jgi:hypothetical protein
MRLAGRSRWLLAMAGYAYGRLGLRSEALGILDELRQKLQPWQLPMPENYIFRGLGDLDAAFSTYDLAYEQRSGYLAFLRGGDPPPNDPVRSDPRFSALLKKMRLDF